MNPAVPRSRTPRLAGVAIAALSLLTLFAIAAPASPAAPVTADAVLLQADPAPWADNFNKEAMGAVFGDGWETQDFIGVQADAEPGGLFAPHVRFIWIEGSDESTYLADEFIEIHQAALKDFVTRGGRLFINSATNEDVAIEYDGRRIGLLAIPDESAEAVAVNPAHPIFQGPATPNATTFEGDSFAHGRVTGPGLTPLLISTQTLGPPTNGVVLADYVSGAGRVALGSMTVVEFQDPMDAAEALRINLIHYLLSPVPPPDGPPAPPAPEPSAPAPSAPAPPAPAPEVLTDTKKPKVKLSGLPKNCVEDGFRFRVQVSDGSGVGAVTATLDGKRLRKANGKGKPSFAFKVRVPAAKLDKPGRHRIKVVASDSSGNVKRQGAAFKVCG